MTSTEVADVSDLVAMACVPVVVTFVLLLAARWVRSVAQRQRTDEVPVVRYGLVPLAVATLVWAVLFSLAIARAHWARERIYRVAGQAFEQQSERLEADVRAQFDDVLHVLRSIRSTHVASTEISPKEFRKWVTWFTLEDGLQGVNGYGMVEKVQRSQLAAFVAHQRRLGVPDFKVKTAGNAPDLFVVNMVEPFEANRTAWGIDLGAEPASRAAMEWAINYGLPALTGRINLVQGNRSLPGYLYFLPIYDDVRIPEGKEQRITAFRGLAYAPIVLADLVAHSVTTTQGLAHFSIFDGPATDPKALAFDSEYPLGSEINSKSARSSVKAMFSSLRPVSLGGNAFSLQARSSAAFDQSVDTREPLRQVFLESALAVVVGLLLWMLMSGRARAEALAAGMHRELAMLALVAQRTSNAVVFTDLSRRITWVNEGFSRITGYSKQEAIGQIAGHLTKSEHTDKATLAAMREDLQAMRPSHHTLVNRHKSGSLYWIELEIQPLHDDRGRCTGFMGVQSDVTVIQQAKLELLLEKERAGNVLSGTNVGTWESNLRTGEWNINARWALMMGFERDEVLPDADAFWRARLHPDDKVRLDNAFNLCLEGKSEHYSCDVRVRHKSGVDIWILSRAKVMSRREDGRVEWIGGVHTDITESKRTELSLRDMEAFLERAGRVAGIGAWQVDLKTMAIDWNDQTCEIHGVESGYSPSIDGALSFYPPGARDEIVQAMERAKNMGLSWDLTTPFVTADGENRWVRTVGEVEFDDSGAVRLLGAIQDVTSQRLAQIKVERSEALLRESISTINEAFVLFDPDDRLVFCNDKYQGLYPGLSDVIVEGVSFETIVRTGVQRGQFAFAVGRDEEWVQERLAEHFAGNIDVQQKLADGRWLRIIERKMLDGHTVGFRIDITELMQATDAAQAAADALALEQVRLQNILQGTNVGTWEWNVQTGECRLNERWAAMVGYTLDELAPVNIETWNGFGHPDDLQRAYAVMNAHFAGEVDYYECEARMRHKDGHWIWVLDRGRLASRTPEGLPLWVAGTHMDITERRNAEVALAETFATLQAVLNSAVDVGVVATGPDRLITVFNRGAEILLGYDAQDLVGVRTPATLFETSQLAVVRESLMLTLGREPTGDEVFQDMVNAGGPSEWTMVRKDGSTFTASLAMSIMRNAANEPNGYLGVLHDISAQKDYEASLQKAMRLAEQSSVAKSQFLANMSHEIRTPMNAILGMLRLLHNTPLNDRQRDYADKTENAARSLLGLLNDILDFSKVEAGKMQLDPEPFALDALLQDVSVILSSNLGAKNVDLIFDIDPRIPPTLVGDALRIKQVLINLGGNAVKFTTQGQVVLRFKMLALHADRVRLQLAVQDSGIGIAPENQAKIFEAFTQAESSTTRRFGGTGLGLVISTRLVRLMGAEMDLQSILGQGSTFSFTLDLPYVATLQQAASELQASEVVHVLLVDDNTFALESTAAMMKTLGWSVLRAGSGQEAVTLAGARLQAAAAGFDAVFVDWQMPGMDGWETLRQLHRLYGDSKMPVTVMFSGQGREMLAQRSPREQALLQGYLVKPLTASMVRTALEDARTTPFAPSQAQGVSPQGAQELQRLYGMRILLVEDNPINQQVAQELLSSEGAQITLADNGQLGVAAVMAARPQFDAVLMDLQMPVMDGLTAARTIRRELGLKELPLIAMTANAMASDRADCLDAGMNDHVGKPFDLNDLVQTLIRYTHWKAPGVALMAPEVTAAPELRVWPVGIDGAAALARMGGNMGVLVRSMQAFVRDVQTLPDRVQGLLEGACIGEVQRELHSLKGLSATLGIAALSQSAAQAEALAKQENQDQPNALKEKLGEIRQQIATLVPLLQALMERLRGDHQAPVAPDGSSAQTEVQAKMVQTLTPLLAMLRLSDMGAMELHADLPRADDGSMDEALEPLDAAMADMDFERAAEVCQTLMDQWKTGTGTGTGT